MSNISNFLSGAGEGLTNPKGLVGNWTHATKLFVDSNYRLSPRTKFLFYVQFEIDKDAMKAPWFTAHHTNEVGMLVRSADLPKFSFDTTTKNQYNRKKLLYKTIKYDPVNISLHDDSDGIVNAMWKLYYGYHIADTNRTEVAYSATHYAQEKSPLLFNRFGMDNDISVSFFKSVSIYTMSRKRFVGYTLINPRITRWQHGNVDYFDSDTLAADMTLEYEAVKYSGGTVEYDQPKGFANLHYDTLPSPLTVVGGGVDNLLGEGGVLDGMQQVLGSVADGSAFSSPEALLGMAVKAVNTGTNLGDLSKDSMKAELWKAGRNMATGALAPIAIGAGMSALGAISGMAGTIFPNADADATLAGPKVTGNAVTDLKAAEAAQAAKTKNATTSLRAAEARIAAAEQNTNRPPTSDPEARKQWYMNKYDLSSDRYDELNNKYNG